MRSGTGTLVMLVCAVMLASGQAAAHTALVSSDPPDGSVLSRPPASVTFTFDEELLPGTNTLAINRADGSVAASAKANPSGSTVAIDWPAELGAGKYQVAYRVVSADGHPVTGSIWLQIQEPEQAPSTPRGTQAPSQVSTPGASEPSREGIGTSQLSAPLVLAALAGSVLALVVALVILVARRRHRAH